MPVRGDPQCVPALAGGHRVGRGTPDPRGLDHARVALGGGHRGLRAAREPGRPRRGEAGEGKRAAERAGALGARRRLLGFGVGGVSVRRVVPRGPRGRRRRRRDRRRGVRASGRGRRARVQHGVPLAGWLASARALRRVGGGDAPGRGGRDAGQVAHRSAVRVRGHAHGAGRGGPGGQDPVLHLARQRGHAGGGAGPRLGGPRRGGAGGGLAETN